MFVVNVPPDATERDFVLLFKSYGTIEVVVFDQDDPSTDNNIEDDGDNEDMEDKDVASEDADMRVNHPRKKRRLGGTEAEPSTPQVIPLPSTALRTTRRSGRTAHIIFLDATSLTRALTPPSKPRPWPAASSSEESSGLSHYISLHASLRPPLDSVAAHANSYMSNFDYQQSLKKQMSKYKKGEAIVDDDGFTLVTRGGAYGKNLGGGVGVASKKFEESGGAEVNNGRRKKEGKLKEGFYGFQKAEKQRKREFPFFVRALRIESLTAFYPDLMDLKQKFEEDKAKVQKLRDSRKFKPY